MNFDYDSWIKQARERLEFLYDQKNAIENEISALEKGIEGFLPLTKHAWLGPTAGLTDSVVKVLSGEPYRLFSATEIRDQLINKGLSLEQTNPLANIHQVLARLEKKDWVKIEVEAGKNKYHWALKTEKMPPPGAPGEPPADAARMPPPGSTTRSSEYVLKRLRKDDKK